MRLISGRVNDNESLALAQNTHSNNRVLEDKSVRDEASFFSRNLVLFRVIESSMFGEKKKKHPPTFFHFEKKRKISPSPFLMNHFRK